MKKTDKIAILMATYNGQKYLREQLDSIREQTMQDWVVFFHDDGSTDTTMEIIREYETKDPARFCYVDGPATGGAKNNFFYLMSQVEAPYYMFCDQDDVWKKKKIELTHNKMLELEKKDEKDVPCLAFTELEVVDWNRDIISNTMSQFQGLDCSKTSINRLLMQNVVTGCTVEINRVLRDMGLVYRDADAIIMHDWWLSLIAAAYGRIEFLNVPTIEYRQHGDNSVGALAIHSRKYLAKRLHQASAIREALRLTRVQAGQFAECVDTQGTTVAAKYAAIGQASKRKRLCFYLRHDMRKTNLTRNIGLFIWG